MSDEWHKCTDAERALIESCRPGECCILFNGELIKMTDELMSEFYGDAFRTAMQLACNEAGIRHPDDLADYAPDPLDADKPYVRVTVTAKNGRQATATALLSDPRLQ